MKGLIPDHYKDIVMKEKVNNILDFNPIVKKIKFKGGYSFQPEKVAKYRKLDDSYNLPIRKDFLNRPVRDAFVFGKNVPKANVEEFVGYLKVVSSPSFGLIVKKLSITYSQKTVTITVTGEKDALALWQENVKVLYNFYKNL